MLFTQIQLRPTGRWDYFSLLVPALGRAAAEAYLVARTSLGPQSARPGRRNLECTWLFKSVVLKPTFPWTSCSLKSKQPVSSSWVSLLGWVTNISSSKRTELTLSSVMINATCSPFWRNCYSNVLSLKGFPMPNTLELARNLILEIWQLEVSSC